MRTTLRSMSFVAAAAITCGMLAITAPVGAHTHAEMQAASKVDLIVMKVTCHIGSLNKIATSYETKLNKLIDGTVKKADKMRAKGLSEEVVNNFITSTVSTKGTIFLQQARAGLTKTRDAALRTLTKFGSPEDAVAAINDRTDELLAQVEQVWLDATADLLTNPE